MYTLIFYTAILVILAFIFDYFRNKSYEEWQELREAKKQLEESIKDLEDFVKKENKNV
jgi:hypothetical protein